MKDTKKAYGGMILKNGNSEEFDTGKWRSKKPIHITAKCKNCMLCILPCPDNATLQKDGKMIGFDLTKCKGCGICAKVCPFGAIEMTDEGGTL